MILDLYSHYNKPYELDNFNDRVKLIPKVAFNKAVKIKDKEKFREMWPGGLECIAKDPQLAAIYAYRSGERFIEAEADIAKHSGPSNFYAQNVIKGRWIPGESAMKTDDVTWRSYLYFLKDNNLMPNTEVIE